MMDVTVDAKVSAGYGKEWSSSVGWTPGWSSMASVYHFPDISTCPMSNPCAETYSIVPYVYKAQAKTLAGVTYPYFEQDYFVTARTDAARVQTASPAVVGLIPQAPVITSTTHPNPANWYPTNTVTLEWGQPAGDAAVVTGYQWNLTRSSVVTPTAVAAMTTTHTYENLADGVYYLHIQAVGDGGDLGPITHRAIRVDMNAPRVEFAFNPPAPDGFNGWYKTPITVTVVATDTIGSGVTASKPVPMGIVWLPYTASILSPPIRPASPCGRGRRITWATRQRLSRPRSSWTRLGQPRWMADGWGLTYANVITDEVGNAQLVLGGAVNDALSGRLQVEVKAGDTGAWHPVSAIGEIPIPPDNEFTTAITSLNWIYTPTFEIRGVYPLLGRGVDAAGTTMKRPS